MSTRGKQAPIRREGNCINVIGVAFDDTYGSSGGGIPES